MRKTFPAIFACAAASFGLGFALKTATRADSSPPTPPMPPVPQYRDGGRLATLARQGARSIVDPAARQVPNLLPTQAELNALAASDPAAAWRMLENLPRAFRPRLDLVPLLRAWMGKDPAAAIRSLRCLDNVEQARATDCLLAVLWEEGAELDPARKAVADNLTELMFLTSDRGAMSVEIPANAIPDLEKLPPSPGRDFFLRRAASKWFNRDRGSATAYAAARPEPMRTTLNEAMAGQGLAGNSVRGQMTPGVGRPGAHLKPLGQNEEWAMAWLAKEGDAVARTKYGPFYAALLAKTDLKAALNWAMENLDAKQLGSAVGAALQSSPSQDPAALRALVDELPPGGVKARAAFAAAAQNPDVATVEWLLPLSVGADQNTSSTAFHNIAAKWAEANPEEFKTFAAGHPNADKFLLIGGLSSLASKAPAETAAWARENAPAGFSTALRIWAGMNRNDAASWIAKNRAQFTPPEQEAAEKALK